MHEWYTYGVFVRGEPIAEFALDPGAHPFTGYSRSGHCLFCPACGEIWGTIVATNSQGQVQWFDITQISCSKHFDQWKTPGSFFGIRGFDQLLEYLPNELLRYEFRVNHDNYEATSE